MSTWAGEAKTKIQQSGKNLPKDSEFEAELIEQSTGKDDGMSARLPQELPLENTTNLAQIEEEIVQSRVQYAMAEKQLRRVWQTLGRASDATVQRVKEIGKALAGTVRAARCCTDGQEQDGSFSQAR